MVHQLLLYMSGRAGHPRTLELTMVLPEGGEL